MLSLVIANRSLESQPSIAQLPPGYPSWTGAGLLSAVIRESKHTEQPTRVFYKLVRAKSVLAEILDLVSVHVNSWLNS